MPAPKAVLFDFDGVIADTLNVHIVAWERTFEAMGLDVTPEQCAKAAEVDDRDLLAGILAEKKVEGGDVEGWVRRKQDATSAMLRDEPRVFPGVVDLIRRLEEEAKLAVVSTALRGDIDAALGAAGIASAIAAIVSKEDVSKTKPDPEPYRTALQRLGVSAGEAVAIEDSATGLKAARAAGIRCVAVGHRQAKGRWAGDATFVESLADVDEVMGVLGFSGRDA